MVWSSRSARVSRVRAAGNWVDWRNDEAGIRERLTWPADGICFDVEHGGFWMDEWGKKPADLGNAFSVVRRAVAAAPMLIPICSHRYLPVSPCESGNPVFSVHQTDIIYYGEDLMDYLQNEFSYYFGRSGFDNSREMRQIAFWSRLVELNE